MSLSQQQLQHLRSLNDAAAICAIARIESLEKAASEQELRERTQNINTEQRFHELQARVAAISFEALQYKKQIEDLEAQVSSLVSKEKELLARHSDASLAAARPIPSEPPTLETGTLCAIRISSLLDLRY